MRTVASLDDIAAFISELRFAVAVGYFDGPAGLGAELVLAAHEGGTLSVANLPQAQSWPKPAAPARLPADGPWAGKPAFTPNGKPPMFPAMANIEDGKLVPPTSKPVVRRKPKP